MKRIFRLPMLELNHGETFVICNPGADPEILNKSDNQDEFLKFDGHEFVYLTDDNWTFLDSVGYDYSLDGPWTDRDMSTSNQVLVRKSTVSSPKYWYPEFALSEEWISYPAGDFSHLGSHIYEATA